MNLRTAALAASGLLVVMLGALGSSSADAIAVSGNESASSVSSLSAAEKTAVATVAAYQAAHPKPLVDSKNPAVYQEQVTASLSWWKAAPLSAMYAQWGCTVSDPSYGTSTDGKGVRELNVSFESSCNSASAPLRTEDFTAPRDATPAGARASVSSPADSTFTKCSPQSAYCFFEDFTTGEISAKYTLVVAGTFTGSVRLGEGSGSGSSTGCSNGPLYAQSANHTISEGSSIAVISTTSVDRTWSDASIYASNGATRGHFCYPF